MSLELAGCANAPPIGSGLPRRFDDASKVFDDRIRSRFPIGYPEASLVAELTSQGFRISRPTNFPPNSNQDGYTAWAIRTGNMGLTCELDWTVLWRAEAGRITVIHGHYEPTCL